MLSIVNKLCIKAGKVLKACVLKVQKRLLTHNIVLRNSINTQNIHNKFTAVLNNYFTQITDIVFGLYTPSTAPIKTTKYINKEY